MIVTVGTDGTVKAVKVVKGPSAADQGAPDAVIEWRYRPTPLNGNPVQNDTRVTWNFVAQGVPGPLGEHRPVAPFAGPC